jgi:hypothetical protein
MNSILKAYPQRRINKKIILTFLAIIKNHNPTK